MAHFAELDSTNLITKVIVVNNEVLDPNNEEESGIQFLTKLFGHSNWKQTSYNNSFRTKFAGIGDTYDAINDRFIETQPYPSWILNDQYGIWEAPVPKPDESNLYTWNESNLSWDKIE